MSSYKPAPPPPSRVHTTTPEAPFQAAPTRRTESGEPRRPFRQPPRSVVVARWGDDVQLDCRVESSNLIRNKEHGDVVIGKFRDVSAKPRTDDVKRLALLNWAIEYCRFADFTLIATHEFVNPVLLKTFIKDLTRTNRQCTTSRTAAER
ncbi:hypothetical protein FJT64_015338 [Amphibalanus amphitrite]|uniref:Uncharacterized protein n=1 Tax=Amphibalanus amphitrite TaxID=1232801 RepID=A0A6A4XDW8_AMPAM|nr:hypothetical protein FJT64_015338 [Amphibalanus amphitrite]